MCWKGKQSTKKKPLILLIVLCVTLALLFRCHTFFPNLLLIGFYSCTLEPKPRITYDVENVRKINFPCDAVSVGVRIINVLSRKLVALQQSNRIAGKVLWTEGRERTLYLRDWDGMLVVRQIFVNLTKSVPSDSIFPAPLNLPNG